MMGGSHDSGSGEKLNFLSLEEVDSDGSRPRSGARDSNEVTLSNNDMSKYIYCCTGAEAGGGSWSHDSVIGVVAEAPRSNGGVSALPLCNSKGRDCLRAV
jgi:hypothetical protein